MNKLYVLKQHCEDIDMTKGVSYYLNKTCDIRNDKLIKTFERLQPTKKYMIDLIECIDYRKVFYNGGFNAKWSVYTAYEALYTCDICDYKRWSDEEVIDKAISIRPLHAVGVSELINEIYGFDLNLKYTIIKNNVIIHDSMADEIFYILKDNEIKYIARQDDYDKLCKYLNNLLTKHFYHFTSMEDMIDYNMFDPYDLQKDIRELMTGSVYWLK